MSSTLILGFSDNGLLIGDGWVSGGLKLALPLPVKSKVRTKDDKPFGNQYTGGYVVKDVALQRDDVDIVTRILQSAEKRGLPFRVNNPVIAPCEHRNKDSSGQWVSEIKDTLFSFDDAA